MINKQCEACGSTTDLIITGGMRADAYEAKVYSDDSMGDYEFEQDFQNPESWKEITSWICQRCADKSEAAYEASNFSADLMESQLAESEY